MTSLSFGGRRIPLVMQGRTTEAPLACLAMISAFYGNKTGIRRIRQKYEVSEYGISVDEISLIADKIGLSARKLKVEIDQMQNVHLPAIIQFDKNHYVVLKEIKYGKYEIIDPEVGEIKLSKKSLDKRFTGLVFEVIATSGFKREEKERKLKISQLWTKSLGLKRGIIQLFLLSFGLEVFALSMPFMTQLIVDDVIINRDSDLLVVLGLGFGLIVVFRYFTDLLRGYILIHFSNKISFQFAINVFRHLIRLPTNFFKSRHIGDIVSRFNSIEKLREFMTSNIVAAFIDGIMVVATFIIMLLYSGLLTGVVLISILFYSLIRYATYGPMGRRIQEELVARATENSNFIENINAIQGIKLFGKEQDRISLWQNYLAQTLNAGIRVQKISLIQRASMTFLSGLELVIIAYIGSLLVLNQEMSVGMLLAFFFHKDNFINKSFALVDTIFKFRLLDVPLMRLSEIVLTEQETKDPSHGMSGNISGEQPYFAVSNLAFRFSDNVPKVIENINIKINKNETISIIGPSGVGKSTLLKLLCSIYAPAEGEIMLNGVEVYKLGIDKYRSKIGAVLQDDSLLMGSIADNISFFDKEFDFERVKDAAILASIHDDIVQKPMQYESLIGHNGAGLSGGQAQRVLLARALYRKPEILFLDEATSHLDIKTERLVSDSIATLDVTRILVAHRPETILMADRILRLTHEGLIEISKDMFKRRYAGESSSVELA